MQPLQFRLLVNFHRQSFLIRRLRRVSRQFAILAFIKTVLLIKSLLTFNGNGKEKQILLVKISRTKHCVGNCRTNLKFARFLFRFRVVTRTAVNFFMCFSRKFMGNFSSWPRRKRITENYSSRQRLCVLERKRKALNV